MKSTVTSKGQVTIPIDIRRAVGLETGAVVEFIVNADRRIELIPRQGDLRALRGAVPKPAQRVRVEDMRRAAGATSPSAGTGSSAVDSSSPARRPLRP